MELELGSRPLHHPREWHDRTQLPNGSSSAAPPSAFASTSGIQSQRRRSSAAHSRPAGPPPNLPIPSVPLASPTHSSPQSSLRDRVDSSHSQTNYSPTAERTARTSSLRPGPPPPSNLSAFYQSRSVTSSTPSPLLSTSSSIEDLSDPPPQSHFPAASSRHAHPPRPQDPPTDHLLLTPPEPHTQPRMPSSRRALTQALELAREAVRLDSLNDNPEAAVQAYGRSVALLSEVMERVRRGEESTESSSRSRRRRRSVAAQEEEVRRLQSIHDTYADRMNILSIIYSIPAVPYSSTSVYSAATISTDSAQSISPHNSPSPTSDNFDQIPPNPYTNNDTSSDLPYRHDETFGHDPDQLEIEDPLSMFGSQANAAGAISGLPPPSYHPYASQPIFHPAASVASAGSTPHPYASRGSINVRRPRASSANLPPAPPPPPNPLPPAPSVLVESSDENSPSQQPKRLDVPARQRGESVGQRDANLVKLSVLDEELGRYDESRTSHRDSTDTQRIDTRHLVPDTPRIARELPLPPLPSPSPSPSGGNFRNSSPGPKPPPSPQMTNGTLRPRASSQMLSTLEQQQQQQQQSQQLASQNIINSTTTHGTIFQRRTTKISGPQTSRPASPTDSVASAGSIPIAKPVPSLPGPGVIAGRSRSSSQPGRRPSLVNGRLSPMDQRPPLPGPNNPTNGMRKTSYPSKLNPNAQASHLSVQTDLYPASLGGGSLIPPPSSLSGNLPTTPTSPLPPAPPNDPLRKPYHMMSLLRNTMESSTGGYVTRRLHVPKEVWSQGGAKLSSIPDKVRVVGILCSALDDLQMSSSEYFGAGNVSSGMALGIGSIGRKEGDGWLSKLEDFSSVCDGVVADFGKKLGVGEGFAHKKTTWGDKWTRRFDKLTTGKNLDSPDAYVQGLKRLFLHAQLLDEHTRAATAQPIAPVYAALPADLRASAEAKLKRSSEFFASVVLTFVVRDLSQLLDKYAKKCEKWLAE